MLDKLADDDIPNIKFNVSKTYGVLVDVLTRLPPEGTIYTLETEGASPQQSAKGMELIKSRILPKLEKLQKDDDVDVRYFATTARQGLSGASEGEPMNTSP